MTGIHICNLYIFQLNRMHVTIHSAVQEELFENTESACTSCLLTHLKKMREVFSSPFISSCFVLHAACKGMFIVGGIQKVHAV